MYIFIFIITLYTFAITCLTPIVLMVIIKHQVLRYSDKWLCVQFSNQLYYNSSNIVSVNYVIKFSVKIVPVQYNIFIDFISIFNTLNFIQKIFYSSLIYAAYVIKYTNNVNYTGIHSICIV